MQDKLNKDKLNKLLFPYDKVRAEQDDLLLKIDDAVRHGKSLVVHAPTGLGKSAASLAPCLAHALEKKLTVFFLTSRHTQHLIAIDTLKAIVKKHNTKILAVDIIGKKWMCAMPGIEALTSNEFVEYCKAVREDKKCEFYANVKGKGIKLSVQAEQALDILSMDIHHAEEVIEHCIKEKLCPYEIAAAMAKKASVIIGDYYYVISPGVRENFFKRSNKDVANSILIFDEGHNLPKRVRDLMTSRLSNFMVNRAIKEAKKYGYIETISYLTMVQDALNIFSKDMQVNLQATSERMLDKNSFIKEASKEIDYEELIAELMFIGDSVREQQKTSYIGAIANFLESWQGEDEGFARILSITETKYGLMVSLSYRCLDPSIITKELIEHAYSTILMSGTLTPTEMYKELLGFKKDTLALEYKNPFPKKNRLVLIVPETSTKYSMRSESQYKEIASACSKIINIVPGNSAVYFPSYSLRNSVYHYMAESCIKTVFLEDSKFSKQDKREFLERFKEYKDSGAVLLGVAAGSFGEGIDLPGDLLKCVIVVGIPLQRPDLETKELIKYYDGKFKKGWDYGYIMPAITKALQNAGRCIRSEEDKGVIIFLDQRYSWPSYKRCFPLDWETKMIKDHIHEIRNFFVPSIPVF